MRITAAISTVTARAGASDAAARGIYQAGAVNNSGNSHSDRRSVGANAQARGIVSECHEFRQDHGQCDRGKDLPGGSLRVYFNRGSTTNSGAIEAVATGGETYAIGINATGSAFNTADITVSASAGSYGGFLRDQRRRRNQQRENNRLGRRCGCFCPGNHGDR